MQRVTHAKVAFHVTGLEAMVLMASVVSEKTATLDETERGRELRLSTGLVVD